MNKTKRSSHGTQPVPIGRDQGTPCVELQVVVWILDKKVLREPAGSETELVTAEVYLSQLKNTGCCMNGSCQCKLLTPDVYQPRNSHTQQGLLVGPVCTLIAAVFAGSSTCNWAEMTSRYTCMCIWRPSLPQAPYIDLHLATCIPHSLGTASYICFTLA